MSKLLRTLAQHLLDLIFPRTCVVCGMRIAPFESCVCTECALGLAHYSELHYRAKERLLGSPLFQSLSAPFAYQQESSAHQLIIALKYHGVREVADFIVRTALYQRCLQPSPEEIDVIIPVPSSSKRLAERGFNQAGLLAHALSSYYQAPVSEGIIRRRKQSTSQTKLSKEERRENAQASFFLTKDQQAQHALAGKRVLLVDDVLTSGATALAICDLLEACGVTSVHLFVAAVAIRW